MKKILALVLALMLALSCTGVLAEAIRIDTPVETETKELPEVDLGSGMLTATAALRLDEATVTALISMAAGSLPEEVSTILPAVFSFINNLSIQAGIFQNGAQVDVLLKDTSVAALGFAATNDGLVAGSDLIPNYLVTVSNETIQQLMEMVSQMTNQTSELFNGIDTEALTNAVMPHIAAAIAEFQGKIGEPEAGEFEFEGATFTTRIPVNMTSKELVALVLNTLKDILSEEAVAEFVETVQAAVNMRLGDSNPINLNLDEILASLEQAAADIENTPDENQPDLTLALYQGEAGNVYIVAEMIDKTGTGITAKGGMVNGSLYLRANVLDDLTVDAVIEPAETGVKYDAQINFQGTAIALTGEVVSNENGVSFNAEFNIQGMYIALTGDVSLAGMPSLDVALYFMNPASPLLSLSVVTAPGAEATVDLNPEGKTLVDVMELISGMESPALQGIMEDLTNNGLNGALNKVMTVMPDEVTSLMTIIMSLTSPGQGAAVVEEAPAE